MTKGAKERKDFYLMAVLLSILFLVMMVLIILNVNNILHLAGSYIDSLYYSYEEKIAYHLHLDLTSVTYHHWCFARDYWYSTQWNIVLATIFGAIPAICLAIFG